MLSGLNVIFFSFFISQIEIMDFTVHAIYRHSFERGIFYYHVKPINLLIIIYIAWVLHEVLVTCEFFHEG